MEDTRKTEISFEEFSKIDIKVGTILTAEKVEGADRLLKLTIEFGRTGISGSLTSNVGSETSDEWHSEVRTIVSGIAQHYQPEELIGKQVPVVMNLAPRKIKGIESQGMVIFASTVMLNPQKEVPPGSSVQ